MAACRRCRPFTAPFDDLTATSGSARPQSDGVTTPRGGSAAPRSSPSTPAAGSAARRPTRPITAPKVLGGADDEINLQALCKPCHSRITASALTTLKRGTGAGEVELVCGPPGAGKTSYVLERMAAPDVVDDVDRLFVALTGLDDYDKPEALVPFVLAARDPVVAAVAAGIGSVRKLWLITGGATERQRRRALGPLEDVRVTVLRPTAGECYRRIAKDPRRAGEVPRARASPPYR